jgi:hypothetical protein
MASCSPEIVIIGSVFAVIWTASLTAILIEIERLNRFLKGSVWLGLEAGLEEAGIEVESDTETQAHEE